MYRTFDEWIALVAKQNPAGLSKEFIDAARHGWDACAAYGWEEVYLSRLNPKKDEEGLNPKGPAFL